MNLLRKQAEALGATEEALLDVLQNNGVISDNCITTDDVSLPDQDNAIEWIKFNLEIVKNELH